MASESPHPDESAAARFEAAALPWMGALHHKALSLTRRPAEAADLVQETFLRAFRSFSSFTEGVAEGSEFRRSIEETPTYLAVRLRYSKTDSGSLVHSHRRTTASSCAAPKSSAPAATRSSVTSSRMVPKPTGPRY